MYPPVPSKHNMLKSQRINIRKVLKDTDLNSKILTKRQLLLKEAEKRGIVFEKKPTVAELEQKMNITKRKIWKTIRR